MQLNPNDEDKLKKALKEIDEKEARTLRIYACGKITDAVWNSLWEEWQDQRRNIGNALNMVSQKTDYHIANVDDTLTMIAQIGVLFEIMSLKSQKQLLHEVVEKVVISLEGKIVRLELRPPFGYLDSMLQQIEETNGAESGQTKTTSITGGNCSNLISSVGPEAKSSVN